MKISLPRKKTIKKILCTAALGATIGILYAIFTVPISLTALTATQLSTAAIYGMVSVGALIGLFKTVRFSIRRFFKLNDKVIDEELLEGKSLDCRLKKAIHKNEITQIESLIACGADVNAESLGDQTTVLMLAALYGHTDVVSTLLASSGIDVNKINAKGYTALMYAVELPNIAIVNALLNVPTTQVNQQAGLSGNTALMLAAEANNTSAVQALLAVKSIQVNLQNRNGRTALMLAARRGHVDIVKILVGTPGINLTLKSHAGNTALVIAAKYKKDNIIPLLIHLTNSFEELAFCIQEKITEASEKVITEQMGKVLFSAHPILNKLVTNNISDLAKLVLSYAFEHEEKWLPSFQVQFQKQKQAVLSAPQLTLSSPPKAPEEAEEVIPSLTTSSPRMGD